MRAALLVLLCGASAAAECVPFTEARKHLGDSACIRGKVLKVARSPKSGTHFLNFCENYRDCAFSVVVFAKDLPRVGDITQLTGQEIEIYGKVKEYRGQAEMVLNDVRQLKGGAAKLPPLSKQYDAANRGKYSAGKFSGARDAKPKREKHPRNGPDTTEPPEEPDR